jgi:hypothetical protein
MRAIAKNTRPGHGPALAALSEFLFDVFFDRLLGSYGPLVLLLQDDIL